MPDLEAHERMRWAAMNDRQLWTRLHRIKNPEKLELFMRLAMEHYESDLFDAALERAVDLGVGHLYGIRQVADEYAFRRQDATFSSRTPAREERWGVARAVRKQEEDAEEREKVKTSIRKIRF